MPKEITFDKFIRWAGVTLIVFAVLYITNYLSEVLLPFVIAWFFAYLLYPVVKFIENKLHIKVRALSIILAMGAAIAVIGGVLWLIIPPMIDQFDKLGEVLTRWLHQTTHTNNLTAMIKEWLQENQAQIEHFLKSKDFSDALKTTMPKLFSVVGQTANIIISIVASMITLLYMFFILLDYDRFMNSMRSLIPQKYKPTVLKIAGDIKNSMNRYFRGQTLVALCVGVLFSIGFLIIDLPLAIIMGMFIGLLNMVPYLQLISLLPTTLLCVVYAAETNSSFWVIFALAMVVYGVVQLIQDLYLVPKIMGKTMGLNPAIILLSLSIWGSLLGFLGLIIALPLTTLLLSYYNTYVLHEGKPEQSAENQNNGN